MDDRINNQEKTIEKILLELEDYNSETYIHATSSDTKIANTLSVLGMKPKLLDRTIDGPDLWAVVGSISNELGNKWNTSQFLELTKEIRSLEIDLMNVMVKANTEIHSESGKQRQYIKNFEKAATSIFNNIKMELSNINQRLLSTDQRLSKAMKTAMTIPTSYSTESPISQDYSQDISLMKSDIMAMNAKVTSIVASTCIFWFDQNKLGRQTVKSKKE